MTERAMRGVSPDTGEPLPDDIIVMEVHATGRRSGVRHYVPRQRLARVLRDAGIGYVAVPFEGVADDNALNAYAVPLIDILEIPDQPLELRWRTGGVSGDHELRLTGTESAAGEEGMSAQDG